MRDLLFGLVSSCLLLAICMGCQQGTSSRVSSSASRPTTISPSNGRGPGDLLTSDSERYWSGYDSVAGDPAVLSASGVAAVTSVQSSADEMVVDSPDDTWHLVVDVATRHTLLRGPNGRLLRVSSPVLTEAPRRVQWLDNSHLLLTTRPAPFGTVSKPYKMLLKLENGHWSIIYIV